MRTLISPAVEEDEPPGMSPERVCGHDRRYPTTTTSPSTMSRRRSGVYSHPDTADWRAQLRGRARTQAEIERFLLLSDEERAVFSSGGPGLPVAITPYYLALIASLGEHHPLRRTVVPTVHEFDRREDEANDPLHEEADSPVPGVVHRYPDRVLVLLTDSCAAYCRYCTRSRCVGHGGDHADVGDAVNYVAAHPEVRDVLLSGGDPLTLSDEVLDRVLAAFRAIPHVEILRIGTKVPAVLPMRITPALVRVLRRYHPLFISVHATHPDELTPAMVRGCTRLADAGIPLGSQTVLLRGVNDDVPTMRRLMHRLLMARVRPYYLYQCDPIPGSGHFRTSVEKGLEIVAGLRGHTSGYAVPTYVIDAPGGGGKIPLLPDPVVGRDDGAIILVNYAGGVYRYPTDDCAAAERTPSGSKPLRPVSGTSALNGREGGIV